MNKTSLGTSRFGLHLTSVALVALAIATGCGGADEPTPAASSTPAPSPTASPAPSNAAAPKSNPAGTGETVSTHIDNATGGTVALPNGTTIDVPPGAMPAGVDAITVTSATDAAPAEYEAASPVYVFGPDGTVFLKPLKISMPLTLPSGMNRSNLTILWSRANGAPGFDMIPSSFAPVAGSATDYIASGEVTHFSQGFCGVKYTTDPHPAKDAYSK